MTPRPVPSTVSSLFFAVLVASMLVLADVPFAWAHKVNMFAFAEGAEIYVEGYFSDGKRARNSAVKVYDSQDRLLVEGRTDDEGQFTFPIPVEDDLRISLDAGMGHRTEYRLSRAELSGGLEDGTVAQVAAAALAGGPSGARAEQQGAPAADSVSETACPASGGAVDEAAIRRAVGEAIRPLMRSISELQERRGFSDIVGGIGFIVGIVGLFFYFKAKRLLEEQRRSRTTGGGESH